MTQRIRMTMVLVFAALVALPGLAPAAAQDASPAASPAAGRPLDLAAMLLTPADFDAVGLEGYGLAGAVRPPLTLGPLAARISSERLISYLGVLLELQENGWLRQAASGAALPDAPGSYDWAATAASSVTEYATAEGAAAGFAFLEDESGDRPGGAARDLPEARALGDQSEATRYRSQRTGEPEEGYPIGGLNVTIRSGNLVADLYLFDIGGGEPELAPAEALAERLLANMERVRAEGGPGLEPRLLRLVGNEGAVYDDAYVRLGGKRPRTYEEALALLDAATPTPVPARPGDPAPDAYALFTDVGEAGGDPVPGYQVRLFAFASPEEASAALPRFRDFLLDLPQDAPDEYELVPGVETVGDGSFTFTSVAPYEDYPTYYGHRVVARVGATIVDVSIDAPDLAPPTEDFRQLLAAQIACLEADALCEPVPVPDGLAALVPAATPTAATPASATPTAATPEA